MNFHFYIYVYYFRLLTHTTHTKPSKHEQPSNTNQQPSKMITEGSARTLIKKTMKKLKKMKNELMPEDPYQECTITNTDFAEKLFMFRDLVIKIDESVIDKLDKEQKKNLHNTLEDFTEMVESLRIIFAKLDIILCNAIIKEHKQKLKILMNIVDDDSDKMTENEYLIKMDLMKKFYNCLVDTDKINAWKAFDAYDTMEKIILSYRK